MPPITSDTITTPGRTTTRMRLIPAQNRCTPSDVSSTKLLSWLGRRWRRLRMTPSATRSEEQTSELQSQSNLVCRLLLEKQNALHATSEPTFADLEAVFPRLLRDRPRLEGWLKKVRHVSPRRFTVHPLARYPTLCRHLHH